MKIAEDISELSSAKKLQVGAIIVKDNRIISIGYNGTPTGWDNTCEEMIDGNLVTKSEVIHAESNAISKLAKSPENGEGASIFITHSPCMECAKLIYQSGITELYYKTNYRSDSGLNFLKRTNIKIEKIEV